MPFNEPAKFQSIERVEMCKNNDEIGQVLDFLLTKDPPRCILGLIILSDRSERSSYVYH